MIKPDDNVRLLFCLKMKINVLGSDISGAAVPIYYYYPINNNRTAPNGSKVSAPAQEIDEIKRAAQECYEPHFFIGIVYFVIRINLLSVHGALCKIIVFYILFGHTSICVF